MDVNPGEITSLLHQGNRGFAVDDHLVPLVYQELRRVAGAVFRHENSDHTLQPTALVHEAYLRLSKLNGIAWKDRAHFLAMAATLMRRILVDHARAQGAEKRGGDLEKKPFHEGLFAGPVQSREIVALHDALDVLAKFDPRQARVVELRFFAGLTDNEVAEVLGIATRTVKRDWRTAKTWLFMELSHGKSVDKSTQD